ncbi:bifunctional diguanylate cyclase/phosphodiesterase [Sulfurospirillum arcachonense]|uniref:bifunctional diguanylate cyclase/phosphodiesterase n=1 Tax=Sulfurospirillum arcachonense TaxID=57666 RepID=UPI0004689DE1|nr:EAL domain-containing protein [Sulfurospirillum arcachonense]
MDYKKNKNLTKWIVILPLLGILITAFLFIEIFIEQQKANFEDDLRDVRSEIIKISKTDIQERIIEASNFIRINQKILKREARNEVKRLANFPIKMIENTYNNNKNLSKKEILQKIKDRLRDIRFFDNLSGYYFIYDFDGNVVLLPPTPSLEGRNIHDFKDVKKTSTMEVILQLIREKKEGFHEWYWNKPNEVKLKKKIGYIKQFEPLGIFIGTARYEEDINESIREEMKKLLFNTRYGEKGYIFAFDYSGKVISHIQTNLIGTNMWDTVTNDVHIVQNMIKGAELLKEGFFMTYISIYDPTIKKQELKTSYIKDIPELSWVIGTGFTYKEVLQKITNKDKLLEKKLNKTIKDISIMTLIIAVLVMIATLFVFVKLRRILKLYHEDLIDKNIQTSEQKEQLIYQLGHDSLTSLPNRILLSQKLESSILRAKRDNTKIAVMFIDIDNFKSINDSLGHDVGDILLQEVALRFKNSVRSSDMVARLSGDEFIIFLDNCKDAKNITKVLDIIQQSMKKPILLNKIEHKVSLSIGVSIYPDNGEEVQILLKNADIAMYKAKENGKNRYKFFTDKINDEIQRRIEVEKSLHEAIEKKEFLSHYQPLVNTKSGKIVGVEALIRWLHPSKGLIFPDEFMPIAEDSNLIVEIGNRVIYESFTQMVKWKEKGYGLEKISINIAARQLESKGFVNYIKKMLKETSCKAEWIELEIVERYAMKNPTKSIEILNQLRKMNIAIAIDDFGTGYSSLSYIKQFPITKLKIDRAFIKNIIGSYKDQAIAEAIIALAYGLRMEVLAEGVETHKEKEFLMSQKCYLMQGYFFSKPLPLDEVEILLEKGIV